VRALTGGLGPRASEHPYARERICVAGLPRRGAPRAWTHVTPGHTVRATWRTWICRRAGRGSGRFSFAAAGCLSAWAWLADRRRAGNRSGRPARLSLPMRSTPHVPSGGHPARGRQDSTESGAISAKQENSLRAITFRDQVPGGGPKGSRTSAVPSGRQRHRRTGQTACHGPSSGTAGRMRETPKFRGVGTFSQDEYVAPEVSWRLEYSGRPARLRRTVCASGSPHPHQPLGNRRIRYPQRPYVVSLLRDLVRRLRVELGAGAG
jgi:hypothetical protein